ncbi:efflux RND transporter periplasmic adaptor subunit [Oceanobacter mangrovi]|uniref:efflux RND transporter periplasmic adaptor subunit n=1 Tax=Oceanobacter mangrovi TaxID=2862510 RepID=UPI001C8E6C85|nr:efflux RND transporter periplasmic adaptor subunit [Oceanobacter mangrovi]
MGRKYAGSGYLKLPLMAALVVTLSACQEEKAAPAAAAQQMPPPAVDVVTVSAQSFQLTDTLAGRVTAYRVAEIRPQVNGIILRRFFEEGTSVKAGDKLYQIDPTLYQANLESAKASLAVAEANAYSARLKADRYAELSKKSAISRQDVDDSSAAALQAEAQVKAAKAAVESARVNLGYTEITAPISGVISRSTITEGSLVSAQQASPLTVIRQTSPVYVDVQAPALSVVKMQQESVSANVALEMQDGSVLAETGKIQFADVGVDQGTGTVNVRSIFENKNHALMPGMFVRARIAVDHVDSAILVPQRGVSRNPDGSTTVMLVDENNTVQMRPVVVTRAVGDQWLVASGLSEGQRVIVSGLQKIKPGIPVSPNPVSAGTEAGH